VAEPRDALEQMIRAGQVLFVVKAFHKQHRGCSSSLESTTTTTNATASPPLSSHHQNVIWSTPRKDNSQQSSDLRKAEIFINNRSGSASGDDAGSFCCFELYRYEGVLRGLDRLRRFRLQPCLDGEGWFFFDPAPPPLQASSKLNTHTPRTRRTPPTGK